MKLDQEKKFNLLTKHSGKPEVKEKPQVEKTEENKDINK